MNDFLQTALTFPTLPWSIFFTACALYWLVASLGLVGHHHADGGGGGDGGGGHHDVQHGDGHNGEGPHDASLLARLGLDGVPLMVMLACLSFCGWLACYFTQLLVLRHLPPATRLLPDLLTLILSLVPAVALTNWFIRPVRQAFKVLNPDETKRITGLTGTVSTPYADERYGMAEVHDGGAGLLLQIRTRPGQRFGRGQQVVLLDYRPDENSYLVAAEAEF